MTVKEIKKELAEWWYKLKRTSLQFQFNLFYIGVLMILVPSITIFCYTQSQKVLYEVVAMDIKNLLRKSNQIADSKLQLVKEYVFGFLSDNDVHRILRQARQIEDESQLYFLDTELKGIVDKYFLSSPDIYSVNIMTNRYNFGIMQYQNYIPEEMFEESELYDIGMQSKEKLTWVPTYQFYKMYHQPELEAITSLDYYYLFSMVKNLEYNLRGMEGEGYEILTINFTDSFWDDVFLNIPEYQDMEYFIVDDNGYIISHTDKNLLGKDIPEDWISKICTEESGSCLVKKDGEEWMLIFDRSDVTGWISVFSMNKRDLARMHLEQIRNNSMLIFAMLLFSVVVFSKAIHWLVVHPVIDLTRQVAKIEKEPEYRIAEKGSLEFRDLIHTYNQMNDNVQKLTRQNYETMNLYQESKLRELNLQLNPHFIYNVLNLLNLELIRDGEWEGSELVEDVIYMMRYILGSDDVTEDFRIDLEYTLHYMDVINKRYDDIYKLEINVDSELYTTKVPKFMLQPIVENVFKHAFLGGESDRRIRIYGTMKDGARCFMVEDNGCGIGKEKMEQINAGTEMSVGLNMTMERIKYLYGEAASLYVESLEKGGTRVCIILPA